MLKQIRQELIRNATPAHAASIRKFVPGATEVYGVKNPVLNEIAVKYKNGGFQLVEELWNSGSYEEKTIAAKMLRKLCNSDPKKALSLVERFSDGIDNWAVCDTLGMQSLKPVNKKIAEEIFALAEKLSYSQNMWQRRLSLVIVEDFCKTRSFHPAIKKLIHKHKRDDEHYIKKAVDWLSRNLEKDV